MSHKRSLPKPPSQRGNRPTPPTSDRSLAYNPDDPLFVARHEAGHAVVGVALGLDVKFVHIRQEVMSDGRTSQGFTDCPCSSRFWNEGQDRAEAALPFIAQAMAGPLAEMDVNSRSFEYASDQGDRSQAHKIATVALIDPIKQADGTLLITPAMIESQGPEIINLVQKGIEFAIGLVTLHDEAITEVARLLIIHKQLSGDEVAEVVRRFDPRTAA